jgi:hypothetical protein
LQWKAWRGRRFRGYRKKKKKKERREMLRRGFARAKPLRTHSLLLFLLPTTPRLRLRKSIR